MVRTRFTDGVISRFAVVTCFIGTSALTVNQKETVAITDARLTSSTERVVKTLNDQKRPEAVRRSQR